MEPKIYGLITDENILKYCKERGIPSFLQEPIERVVEGERDKNSIFGYDRHKPGCIECMVYRAVNELGASKENFNIFLTGSGRYHHITYGLLKNLNEGRNFSLVSLDHHEDFPDHLVKEFGNAEERFINLGNHNYFSLRDIQGLGKIVTISKVYEEDYKLGGRNFFEISSFKSSIDKKIVMKKTEDLSIRGVKNYLSSLGQTYLTIDIDALNYCTGVGNYEIYSQGFMSPKEMEGILYYLLENINLSGLDITGLTPYKGSFDVYDWIIKIVKENYKSPRGDLHSRPADYESAAPAS